MDDSFQLVVNGQGHLSVARCHGIIVGCECSGVCLEVVDTLHLEELTSRHAKCGRGGNNVVGTGVVAAAVEHGLVW